MSYLFPDEEPENYFDYWQYADGLDLTDQDMEDYRYMEPE